MNKKTGFLLGIALVLAVGAQADEVIVQWGELNGDTNMVAAPTKLATVSTTYTPRTESNPPAGTNYYANATGRSPVFNATANDSPVSVISIAHPGAAAQITVGTGQTNFQQMVVWEKFPTENTTLTSLAMKLFPYGYGFTNGTHSFVLQKSTGQWYASAPVALVYEAYTSGDAIDPATLSWHEFTPVTNGVGAIGAPAKIDMKDVQAVGYYTDINGTGKYVGTYTLYFQAKGAGTSSPSMQDN